MNGSASCYGRGTGAIAQLAFSAHYGASLGGLVSPAAYHGCHALVDWNGPGWTNPTTTPYQEENPATWPAIDPHALVLESLKRFTMTQWRRENHLVVVFSTMMWDLARRCLVVQDEPFEHWAHGFRSNYTKLAQAVAKAAAEVGATLVLVVEYEPSTRWYCLDSKKCSGAINLNYVHFAQRVVREVAAQDNRTWLLDSHAAFTREGLGKGKSRAFFLQDDRHANKAGRELLWSELQVVVRRTLQQRINERGHC